MQSIDIKQGPEDAWGNVKVPRIESLDPSAAGSDGWIPFSTGNVDAFSSLLGLPVVGLPSNGSANFTAESSYLTLSCSGYEKDTNYTTAEWMVSSPENAGPNCPIDNNDRIQMLLGANATSTTNSSELYAQEIDLYFSDQSTHARCTVSQTNVETNVRCIEGSCTPMAVRQSSTDQRPKNVTVFDYWGWMIASGITSASLGLSGYSSASEFFLSNSSVLPVSAVYYDMSGTSRTANYSKLTPEVLSARVSILLNTYTQLLLSSTGFAGNLPAANLSVYGPEYTVPATALNNTVFYSGGGFSGNFFPCDGNQPVWMERFTEPFVGASTTATHALVSEVYMTNYGWATVMFVSSIILLCSSVLGVILRLRVNGPDVFDPVAAWTYDNPALPVPSGGMSMDIGERIRALKDVEVRLGDVWGARVIGKVALGRKSETDKLREGKIYV
jgi:hypothetical protein